MIEQKILGTSNMDLAIAEFVFGYQWIEISGYKLIVNPRTLETMVNYSIADKSLPIYPNPSSLDVPSYSTDANLATIALERMAVKGWQSAIQLREQMWGIDVFNVDNFFSAEDKQFSKAIALAIIQCSEAKTK